MLLLRRSVRRGVGKVEAFGWLAVDGAFQYPLDSPSRSQLAALKQYTRTIRHDRGGVDELLLPVELRYSSGGIFSEIITDDVQDMRKIRSGIEVPSSISSRLSLHTGVSAGVPLPRGARSDIRAWRVLLFDGREADIIFGGDASGLCISRNTGHDLGFTIDEYPACVFHRVAAAADIKEAADEIAVDTSESEEENDENNFGVRMHPAFKQKQTKTLDP